MITEKPSVARDLARVLGLRGKGDGFLYGEGPDAAPMRISWCFGHMAELCKPDAYDPVWKRWDPELLPILPDRFELQARKGAEDQVRVLRDLLGDGDTTEVINACDAGREGELIFRYVMQLADCDTPVRRLWVSSLTDQAIRRGWAELQAGARYDDLADAARCRAEADWLIGMNATRALTCLARSAGGAQLLSVGRVQTPTLAMIVARDAEIEAFEPEDFWQVRGTFEAPGDGPEADRRFVATWFQRGGLQQTDEDDDDRSHSPEDEDDGKDGPARSTRLPTEAAARAVTAALADRDGVVVASERKRKRDRPPLLYDLTSLQRRANQRYGMSAERTLEVAQALYEKHKLITYPRTDARFLTPDQVGELPGILRGVASLQVYAPFVEGILEGGDPRPGKRVIDAEEVGDHHAILPTDRGPEPGRLSADEKRIYDLVARRLLAALSADALFDVARIELAVDPGDAALPDGVTTPLHLRARGRMRVQAGWQAVDPPKKRRDTELPPVDDGAELPVVETTIKAGQTRPPRPHNDASLLKAMETAGRELDDRALRRAMRQSGLGTPATRAAILTTLERRGFVTRSGKHIRATDRGRSLIESVPVDELKSAELTGRWEARLAGIAEGRDARDAFMEAARQHTTEIVAAILAAEPPAPEFIEDDRPVLGECPVCGKSVREGRKAYSCDSGRACSFVIFQTVAKRKVSKRSVKQLLTDGRTPVLKNFKSRKGKAFDAALVLDEEGKVRFDFPPREPQVQDRSVPDPMTAADPVGLPCPSCRQGRVIRGRTAWGCSRWREGCGWRRTG